MSSPELTVVQIAGVQGCVHDAGAGATLVLLVTPFARASLYAPTIASLAERFHVVAVEMPGCGCGTKLARSWDLQDYANWVAAFLETMAMNEVILIGHSHSGAVALRVAASCGQRVTAVVLADAVGAGGPRFILPVLLGCLLCALMEPRFVLRGVPKLLYNLWRHTRNFVMSFWRAVRADLSAIAPEVQVPALLAWGRWDFIMPLTGAARLSKSLRMSTLYISKWGSHDWLIERPVEFARAVTSFVENVTLQIKK